MADRATYRLAAVVLPKLGPGMHHDGNGLHFRVTESGARGWVHRYQFNGRRRHMGLGGFPKVSLQEARQKATLARQMLGRGEDPLDTRQAAKAQARLRRASAMLFNEAAEAYIAAQRDGWRNAKHRQQWANTLETYAGPVLGDLDVAMVDTSHVLKVLEPIWQAKNETAVRLRGRIERVLDWAKVRGLRQGENPARWRGHLEHMLPSIRRGARIEHHPALPYDRVGRFMKALRKSTNGRGGAAARALEFTILTAARTGEVLYAKWAEIDLKGKVWTVPAARTKTGRELRVPLSPPAIKSLQAQARVRENAYVFPGRKADRPLSNMAMLVLLRRMQRGDITPHGFRSTFRDWAAEQTSYPREIAEMALGHVVGNAVERAYRRDDLFEKRARLMRDWANWCAPSR
jgi:integrase